MQRRIECCRLCGNPNLNSVLSLGEQVLTGVFPRTPDVKLTAGSLELMRCDGPPGGSQCGLVQLRDSYDPREMYGDNYGYRSSLNRSMVRHLQGKVASLLKLVTPAPGDLIIDIGSNDGTLLSFYPSGKATLVGIDPTAAKFRQSYRPDIEVVPTFFSADAVRARFGQKKAKIVTSIAMFYDLEDPLTFVRQVAESLAPDGIWHFEQSYLPSMLEKTSYDTICHEHVEYYALKQIKWMMERAGLRLIDVDLNDVNGGSFAVTVAKADGSYRANDAAIQRLLIREAPLETPAPYAEFVGRVLAHRRNLIDLLARLRSENRLVLGYGASTKGNVILQYCGLTRRDLPAIAEVNPDKFGCFTPGTNIPIVSETEARAMRPDYFLVLPWHFRQDLQEREEEFLRGGGKMIFPLPEIEIIG